MTSESGLELGAGGVVFNDAGEVLLVRYASGGWAFPKGHIDPGETPDQTAVREVREETGVTATILAALAPTRYTNDRGVAREISWFLMRAEETGTVLEAIFQEGGFFEADKARQLLSYPEDQALLVQALTLARSV